MLHRVIKVRPTPSGPFKLPRYAMLESLEWLASTSGTHSMWVGHLADPARTRLGSTSVVLHSMLLWSHPQGRSPSMGTGHVVLLVLHVGGALC